MPTLSGSTIHARALQSSIRDPDFSAQATCTLSCPRLLSQSLDPAILRRVGEVVGMADGKICVRWASGQQSQLPPQVLLPPWPAAVPCGAALFRSWAGDAQGNVEAIMMALALSGLE